jgi:hypothetical protein
VTVESVREEELRTKKKNYEEEELRACCVTVESQEHFKFCEEEVGCRRREEKRKAENRNTKGLKIVFSVKGIE